MPCAAQEGHRKFNFLTHNLANEAVDGGPVTSALQADEISMVPASKKALLHGVPVSIKECFAVKGTDATIGLTKFAGKIYEAG